MDERKAIQRLKKSDISGLEILVAKYQVKAVRTAYLITRDRVLAEDIVQDAFIQAYRSIHSFDTARAFEPWFITIVVNKSLKALRRSDNHVLFKEKPDEIAFTELFENVHSVESQIESRESLEQIWDALQKLSPRQRTVIIQRYFLEMHVSEMAEDSGSADGTIKWLLHEARKKLRRILTRSDL